MKLVAPVRSYIDSLVHDSARSSALSIARHSHFIAVRLIAALCALSMLPLYLVVRGGLSPIEILFFAWFAAPLSIALFVSQTGNYDAGKALSAFALASLATVLGVVLDSVAAAVWVWLMLAGAEALGASRRVMLLSIGCVLTGAAVVLTFGSHGSSGFANGFGVVIGVAYGAMLLLGSEREARTNSRLLVREEQRFRLLSTAMNDVVTLHGRGGTVLSVSPAAEAALGASAQDLLGHGLLDRVHVTDRPAYLSALAEAGDGYEPTVELRVRREVSAAEVRAGRQFAWMEMRFRRLGETASPQVREVVAVMRDVTERKLQEDQVAAARQQAEDASEAKGRFLAMMSHELRTPLNAVIGFSEMLMNDEIMRDDAVRRKEYARLISKSGHHLLSVVNLVLDVSKIESGSFVMALEPTSVGPLIRNVSDLLALKAHEGGLELAISVEDRLPDVVLDERAIKQVLLNLLSNAIKFTPSGGRVTVRAQFTTADELLIAVDDTGVGIPETDLPNIGTPFFQAGGSYSRRYEGTGLGLSIVKGFVDLHGGRLDIASRVGTGTSVKIFLPKFGPKSPGQTVVDLKAPEPRAVTVPIEPEFMEAKVQKSA